MVETGLTAIGIAALFFVPELIIRSHRYFVSKQVKYCVYNILARVEHHSLYSSEERNVFEAFKLKFKVDTNGMLLVESKNGQFHTISRKNLKNLQKLFEKKFPLPSDRETVYNIDRTNDMLAECINHELNPTPNFQRP